MYSISCSSCSFEAEIIKIGQSSHKMYNNNIEGACGVMFIVVGNGYGSMSSNPGRD